MCYCNEQLWLFLLSLEITRFCFPPIKLCAVVWSAWVLLTVAFPGQDLPFPFTSRLHSCPFWRWWKHKALLITALLLPFPPWLTLAVSLTLHRVRRRWLHLNLTLEISGALVCVCVCVSANLWINNGRSLLLIFFSAFLKNAAFWALWLML